MSVPFIIQLCLHSSEKGRNISGCQLFYNQCQFAGVDRLCVRLVVAGHLSWCPCSSLVHWEVVLESETGNFVSLQHGKNHLISGKQE